MRKLDVYYYDSSGSLVLAAGNCVQLAPVSSERESNAETYTMADGSLCVYPVGKDRLTVSVVLECSDSQATNILKRAPGSRFVFAGLDYGFSRSRPLGVMYSKGVLGYLAGKIGIEEISARNDCYRLTIPVQLELFSNTGEVDPVELPSYIGLDTIKFGMQIDSIEEPVYRLRSLDGVIIRNEAFRAVHVPIHLTAVAKLKYDPGENYTFIMRLYDAWGNVLESLTENIWKSGSDYSRSEVAQNGVTFSLTHAFSSFPDVVSWFCVKIFISINGNETIQQEVWFSVQHEPAILSASDGSLFQLVDEAFLSV